MAVKPVEGIAHTEPLGLGSMLPLHSDIPQTSNQAVESVHGDLKRAELSGIDVVIVGAGLGGMFAAIECYRQGHNVKMVEYKPAIEGLG